MRKTNALFLFLSLSLVVSANAHADLVHRWSFNDDTKDTVGGAPAKLEEGAKLEGGAVVLDGERAHVSLPVAFTFSTLTNVTIEGWYTWNGGRPWQRFFDFGKIGRDPADGQEKGRQWMMLSPSAASGKPEMHIEVHPNIAGASEQLVWAKTLPQKKRVHIAVVLRGTIGQLYVDGRLVNERTIAQDPGEMGIPRNCWLGRSNWPADAFLDGSIDEFRIYDHALTQDAVRESYRNGPDDLGKSLDPSPARWAAIPGVLTTRWTGDVSPRNALPEYPRPQLRRAKWLNLNGAWDLELLNVQGTSGPETIRKKILVPFAIESHLSGVMRRAESVRYTRLFEVPEEWKGSRVRLHFGAVDWRTRVLVNGKEVGTHVGGFDAFSFDISVALAASTEGGGKRHELVVEVYDPSNSGNQPRGKQRRHAGGIFYTPVTGIWQTVWLEPLPAASVEDLAIIPDLDAKSVHVTANVAGSAEGLRVEVQAFRLNERYEQVEIGRASGAPGQALQVHVSKAQPWSPRSPKLYDLLIRLKRGDEVVDEVGSYFGLRKIETRKDASGIPRVYLNGKRIFQIGPLDQGFWPDGIYTAPTDAALKYDIQLTKGLGFNMTRKHVKIEPARWYHWCDRLGLLVWQDMPSADNRTPESRAQFEKELRRMIETHRNHPSIVAWVIFNEGWGQHDDARYTKLVRELDPHRLVSAVSGWNDRGEGDFIDIHAYPGPGWLEPDGDRVAVIGEYGGPRLLVEDHTWAEGNAWGYFETKSKDELTATYERLISDIHSQEKFPGVCAAVFTQLTDVEREINGLLTYDRRVVKVDRRRVARANRGELRTLVSYGILSPTAMREAVEWRSTTKAPGDGWTTIDFDDSTWTKSPAGFGRSDAKQGIVRTKWDSGEIWMRREFSIDADALAKIDRARLLVQHGGSVSISINGVPAASLKDRRLYHEEIGITQEARAAIKAGKNVIAVHARGSRHDQYIDVGVVSVAPSDR